MCVVAVGQTKDNFELLCKDGSRRTVDDFKNCNWGTVPSHAVVTTSAKSNKQRMRYQKFLMVSWWALWLTKSRD